MIQQLSNSTTPIPTPPQQISSATNPDPFELNLKASIGKPVTADTLHPGVYMHNQYGSHTFNQAEVDTLLACERWIVQHPYLYSPTGEKFHLNKITSVESNRVTNFVKTTFDRLSLTHEGRRRGDSWMDGYYYFTHDEHGAPVGVCKIRRFMCAWTQEDNDGNLQSSNPHGPAEISWERSDFTEEYLVMGKRHNPHGPAYKEKLGEVWAVYGTPNHLEGPNFQDIVNRIAPTIAALTDPHELASSFRGNYQHVHEIDNLNFLDSVNFHQFLTLRPDLHPILQAYIAHNPACPEEIRTEWALLNPNPWGGLQ